MAFKITETQDKNTTREYELADPKRETIDSFWDYLMDIGVIEWYSIEEV